VTPFARRTLRTYADGMGMDYKLVVAAWQASSQTAKGRALVTMRALEAAWAAEVKSRAEPTRWGRFWGRLVNRVRWWRVRT
jgi:hypothetical protein